MPKKVDAACMFCMEVPCVCPELEKPKKKRATSTSKKSTSSTTSAQASASAPEATPSSSAASTGASTPVDLRAAMKARVKNVQPELRAVQSVRAEASGRAEEGSSSEAQAEPERGEPDDPELAYALAVLEPDLAEGERRKWEPYLDRYYSPIQRWRIRHVRA